MEEYIEISLLYEYEGDYKLEKGYVIKNGDFYQLKSVPVFSHGLAYNDIISVEKIDDSYFFDNLIEPSGHSVLHIVILDSQRSTLLLSVLATYGLGIFYLHNNLYLVIDVPKNVSYKKLREFLLSQIEEHIIDVEEACISDFHYEQLI